MSRVSAVARILKKHFTNLDVMRTVELADEILDAIEDEDERFEAAKKLDAEKRKEKVDPSLLEGLK